MTFREKLAEAMVGHEFGEITIALTDAIACIIAEADDDLREHIIMEIFAQLTKRTAELTRKINPSHPNL